MGEFELNGNSIREGELITFKGNRQVRCLREMALLQGDVRRGKKGRKVDVRVYIVYRVWLTFTWSRRPCHLMCQPGGGSI